MVNILFSGINREKGFNEAQTSCLLKYLENNKKIVFIASVFSDYEKSEYNFKRYLNYFKNINISFLNSNLIYGKTSINEAQELIYNCDYVFLLGGSPELQMKSLDEYGLSDILVNKKLLMGVSAGSMNQTNRVLYKDDFDNYILKDYKGLGLVDVSIYPHFDFDNKEHVNEATEMSFIATMILLPNDSFIVVDNDIEYHGDYYMMKDGKLN